MADTLSYRVKQSREREYVEVVGRRNTEQRKKECKGQEASQWQEQSYCHVITKDNLWTSSQKSGTSWCLWKPTNSLIPSFSGTSSSSPNQVFLRHLKPFPHTCLKPTGAHTSSWAAHLSSIHYQCVVLLITLAIQPPASSSALKGTSDSRDNNKNKNWRLSEDLFLSYFRGWDNYCIIYYLLFCFMSFFDVFYKNRIWFI